MIKTIGLLRARPEMSREAFARYWLEVHAPKSLAVPGIRRYVQKHILQERPPRHDLASIDARIDGFVEMWYDSQADFERASQSPELQALHQDGTVFLSGFKGYIIEEKIII